MFRLAAALLLVGLSAPVGATSYSYKFDVDAVDLTGLGKSYFKFFHFDTPLQFNVGDTVEVTVTAPEGELIKSDRAPEFMYFSMFEPRREGIHANYNWEIIQPSNGVDFLTGHVDPPAFRVGLGAEVQGSDLARHLFRPMEFHGFKVTFFVDSLRSDRPNSLYQSASFGIRNALPEPSVWAALVIGFGGIGTAIRAQRNSGRIRHQLRTDKA